MLKGQFQNFLINCICQIPLMFLQGVIAEGSIECNSIFIVVVPVLLNIYILLLLLETISDVGGRSLCTCLEMHTFYFLEQIKIILS